MIRNSEGQTPTASEEASKKPYYRVFAFPGGGLDMVMQLGIAHALLLVEGRLKRKPGPEEIGDMVVGISTGAINAVALAEILQAGGITEGEPRLAAQVARLLEFLEAYRDAPATVLRGFLPDPSETTYRKALKSVMLPRHFGGERSAREESISSRTGLIWLLNDLLNCRVMVGTSVRFIALCLGWRASHEELNWWKRLSARLHLLCRGWWLILKHILVLSLPVGNLLIGTLFAAIAQPLRRGRKAPTPASGVEAADIMFDARAVLRWFGAVVSWLIGFLAIAFGPLVLTLLQLERLLQCCCPLGRNWILAHYSILTDLGDSFALKEELIRLFDPHYFGKFKLDTALERALDHHHAEAAARTDLGSVHLHDYERDGARPRLKVVALAANLRTGKIEAVPREAAVVDALMAACAAVPFYRAQRIQANGMTEPKWFIDGIKVANDPVSEALDHLRRDSSMVEAIGRNYAGVRIYSAPLLPIEQDALPGQAEPYTGLVEVGLRTKQLHRFQDALVVKRLTETLNRALPRNHSVFEVPDAQATNGKLAFFHADIVHLTSPRLLDLNIRIPGAASVKEQRIFMEEAVADGCRALIERFLTDEEGGPLRAAAFTLLKSGECELLGEDFYVPCHRLFPRKDKPKPGDLCALPGSATDTGPGVPDICRRCRIRVAEPKQELVRHVRLPWKAVQGFSVDGTPELSEQSKERKRRRKPRKPAIAFLFSGGVFRGVFQVGFANAVSELGLKPDIVAGASVGAIMGALVGAVLGKKNLEDRRIQMQRLVGTFLAIDQFVMTDRFADCVRHFAIRAAGANFSLRDADLFFRRFDVGESGAFASRGRRVVAGIERIFSLNPFALHDFTETLRMRDYRSAWSQCKEHVQKWLDQYGVGLEILGAEPLQMLIDSMIFNDKPPRRAGFGYFTRKRALGAHFELLGTVTNLTLGKLEILRGDDPKRTRLSEGLLASSAFPGVFRPRWSWEVFEKPAAIDQFCDGGLMDNFPLDSVIEYLAKPSHGGRRRFPRRPEVPHLILAASLECEPEDWSKKQASELEKIAGSWPELNRRAGELQYNAKIDKFADSQDQIQRIIKHRQTEPGFDRQDAGLPLNIEIAAVKPKWLCGSFAFHPMLGFRREDQAASIAHGCASTIQRLAKLFKVWSDRKWPLPRNVQVEHLDDGGERRQLTDTEQKAGVCWHRCAGSDGSDPLCPFSAAVVLARSLPTRNQEDSAKQAQSKLAHELDAIYHACGQPETHQRR